MAIPFEEYVDRMNKARSVDELLQVFLETVGHHGYDKMIFCLLSDHKQIGLAAGVGHLRNYPADWMKYYFEQGFDQLDPVISYCYQKMGTFTWQEMSERLDLTRKQKLCLNLGTEAGLHNGICTPLWGPHRFAGIGLATTEKKDACDANIDMITAYCNHFYIAFQRLHAPPQNTSHPVPNIYLTREGKRDFDDGRRRKIRRGYRGSSQAHAARRRFPHEEYLYKNANQQPHICGVEGD